MKRNTTTLFRAPTRMRNTQDNPESTFSLRASLDHYEIEEITVSQAAKLLGKAPHQPSISRVATDSLSRSA
jgi:hypothetical protein